MAASKKITLPTALSNKHQKIMDDLSKKNGIDFHKEYISLLVKDHEDEIKEFKKEVDTGKDAEIKTGHPVKYRFWNIIWHQQKIQKNISKTTSKLFLE